MYQQPPLKRVGGVRAVNKFLLNPLRYHGKITDYGKSVLSVMKKDY